MTFKELTESLSLSQKVRIPFYWIEQIIINEEPIWKSDEFKRLEGGEISENQNYFGQGQITFSLRSNLIPDELTKNILKRGVNLEIMQEIDNSFL